MAALRGGPGGLAAGLPSGLAGLLAALTTLLWRALQPIYFSFPGGLGGRRAGGLGVLPDGLAALRGLGWRPRRPRRPWPPTAVDALVFLLQPCQFSCQNVITLSASRASSRIPIAQFLTSERVHRHRHTHRQTVADCRSDLSFIPGSFSHVPVGAKHTIMMCNVYINLLHQQLPRKPVPPTLL